MIVEMLGIINVPSAIYSAFVITRVGLSPSTVSLADIFVI